VQTRVRRLDRRAIAVALVFGALAVVPARARELKPATLAAFERYVKLTEGRINPEVSGASPMLWIDRQPPADREAILQRLRRGDIVVSKLETRDGTRSIAISDGLVHHWIGTVFMPGVTIDRVIRFVQDYPAYPNVFAPTIQRARVIGREGDRFEVAMRTYAHKVITVIIDQDFDVEYRTVAPKAVFSKSVARNIMEVDEAGTPTERRTPSERGRGFLWRLNNYCTFVERPEGTYEQCESVSLTRDVPFGLGWVVRPFVTGIPRETLEFTLGKVRSGVTAARGPG
jgi:hypothetical protein